MSLFEKNNRVTEYIPGIGERTVQGISYTNENGERVDMGAGILRNSDGTPHAAYAGGPGTYVGLLIQKQKKGLPLTQAERKAILDYEATNPTRGLPSVNDLGGTRGARTATNGAFTWGNM